MGLRLRSIRRGRRWRSVGGRSARPSWRPSARSPGSIGRMGATHYDRKASGIAGRVPGRALVPHCPGGFRPHGLGDSGDVGPTGIRRRARRPRTSAHATPVAAVPATDAADPAQHLDPTRPGDSSPGPWVTAPVQSGPHPEDHPRSVRVWREGWSAGCGPDKPLGPGDNLPARAGLDRSGADHRQVQVREAAGRAVDPVRRLPEVVVLRVVDVHERLRVAVHQREPACSAPAP